MKRTSRKNGSTRRAARRASGFTANVSVTRNGADVTAVAVPIEQCFDILAQLLDGFRGLEPRFPELVVELLPVTSEIQTQVDEGDYEQGAKPPRKRVGF